jgi:clan AA aspartic protease (TIGR02281 family)
MNTKIVAILGVVAFAAFASPANAELICGEAVSDGSYASGGGSWSRVVYESDARTWTVEHHLPNGQVISRGEQYNVTDRTDSNRLQWSGTQYRNPRLHMIGEVMSLRATGEPTYNEWLYDDAKGGALVLHTVALCRFDKPAPPTTVQPSGPGLPLPPPAASVAATPLSLPPAPITVPPPTLVTTPAGTAAPAVNAMAADSVPIYSDRGGRGVRVDVKVGGVFVRMLIDTGSTDILISNSLASTLVGAGDAEWLADSDVTLADGTKIKSRNVKIHRVSIGEHTLIDVEAGVNPSETGDMLLGFPILNLFGKFTIDTNANQLTFGSFANR